MEINATEYAASLVDWGALGHVYCFCNGKGGVGKTTSATNVAGLAAADGAKVLLIDMNAQGNIGDDLGYTDSEIDDRGKAFLASLTTESPLVPVRNVRPNLDVIVGGKLLRRVPGAIGTPLEERARIEAVLTLARCLQPIADQYDLIIIDSPPENEAMLQLALGATRFVVIPVKSDVSSNNRGLRSLATDFAAMRKYNPYMVLLGVFLFATGTNATNIRKEVQNTVNDVLSGKVPMFDTFIRHAEAVAGNARKMGKLVYELEVAAQSNPKFWQVRAGLADRSQVVSSTSASVSEDFADLTRELFTRAGKMQAGMVEKGIWP